jgi:transposase InsO family protein
MTCNLDGQMALAKAGTTTGQSDANWSAFHVVRKVWRQLQREGFVYIGFVIDTFARRIVGWRASRTAHADFVLGALEWALHDRRPTHSGRS